MSAESNARSHAQEFRWWRGCPELTDEEARLQDLLALFRMLQGMAMGGIHGILVRNRLREVLGDVEEEVAALGDVQELHADADAEDRHPPRGDHVHQPAVEFLAAGVQRPNRRVRC